MKTVGFVLEPLDVLFFRDGRSFGAACRVVSGLPTPQVLAGAVRTVLMEKAGVSFSSLADQARRGAGFGDSLGEKNSWIAEVRFRGPWLCKLPTTNSAVVRDIYVPMPATVHRDKKSQSENVHLLKPLTPELILPGWTSKLRPLWLNSERATEPAQGFLDSAGLLAFLNAQKPSKTNLHSPSEFFKFDHRTGNEINGSNLAVEEGQLYGISFLALKSEFGFYAELDAPDRAFDGIEFLAFGGEGKRAKLRILDFPHVWPKAQDTSSKRKTVLLTTPFVTAPPAVPYVIRKDVIAAAVNSPLAISGWDLAKNGPKPTRFAAPAGSVYFLETDYPTPDLTDELGYGCSLQGVWTYE